MTRARAHWAFGSEAYQVSRLQRCGESAFSVRDSPEEKWPFSVRLGDGRALLVECVACRACRGVEPLAHALWSGEGGGAVWKFVGVNTDEREFLINGLNVYKFDWEPVADEAAEVRDPLWSQRFTLQVWTVTDGERTVKFAAGEFSNGVFGFYVPG